MQPINFITHTNLIVTDPLCADNYQSNITDIRADASDFSQDTSEISIYFNLNVLIVNILRMFPCIKYFRDGVRCILWC